MTSTIISGPAASGLLLSAIATLMLAAALFARREDAGTARVAIAVALSSTAVWALATASVGRGVISELLFSAAHLAWLWATYRLFARDGRHQSLGPIRPVVAAVALVGLLQFALVVVQYGQVDPEAAWLVASILAVFRILFSVGALVLVHNLYVGASQQARRELVWPASALAAMWLFDLNLFTVAYLSSSEPETLLAFRGAVPLAMVAMLVIGLGRPRSEQGFRPSRAFAFQSLSLLVIGLYFLFMLLAYRSLSYLDGDVGRLAQFAFLAAASALALVLLPSRRIRAWMRVTLAKNLFKHRYDYREEWLRFTRTIGRAGPGAAPLQERVVQAVADIADSPAGLLLAPSEDGGLELAAQWQWGGLQVPAQAMGAEGAAFYTETQFILDLFAWRDGNTDGMPAAAVPKWLEDEPKAWIVVPLLHHGRLHGLVVLARPHHSRSLDWEDFDLLRVIGPQLASYLAEDASQDALGEAQRFDEFNRRIAFVMHDIKNLASQLSLLASNAEKHADNPAFRADMLVTLRNSSSKLETLLSRLGRYGKPAKDEPPVPTDIAALARQLAARHPQSARIEAIAPTPVLAMARAEGLEQALLHLVHNALEASEEAGTPVFLEVRTDGLHASVDVVDSGCGMSPDFLRHHLFRPFHSTKDGGFGIGAMEAREIVRAMGGNLHVESREGLGTKFVIRFPLAAATHPSDKSHSDNQKRVA
ncbi:XrtA/PEP-CTERM system histidine kinase PrsK [Paraurantiacibacter namhicola]|uniref:histidine kinase n=1 Tax=Paraurantiacibacter namhicola TaxID=645517 RepID=A0A1C7D8R1_9SPHN|nr:XrtA/PEP-CTERM system histidine kinase PrsK [Paraurantiacibacter namhicola]ANU07864.1 Sensor protein TorS [Paraurantiacibacter namhicola]